MADFYTPLIYDDVLKQHTLLPTGAKLSPSLILIDQDAASNVLRLDDQKGLSVSLTDVVSEDADNLLKVVDGRLKVSLTDDGSGVAIAIVSADAGNLIRPGLDGGAYLSCDYILSNGGATNLLHIDPIDNRVTLTADDLNRWLDPSVVLSGSSTNLLHTDDANGRVTFTVSDLMAAVVSDGMPGNLLHIDPTDGKLAITKDDIKNAFGYDLDSPVSSDADNLIVPGSDGACYLPMQRVTRDILSPSASNMLQLNAVNRLILKAEHLVSDDTGNMLAPGTDGRLFVSGAGIVSGVAGNALAVDSTGHLYVKPSELLSGSADNILHTGPDGTLLLKMDDLVTTDSGNLLSIGSDGKLAFDSAGTLAPASDNALIVDSAGRFYLKPSSLISSYTDNQLFAGSDGKLAVAVNTMLSSDYGNLLTVGSDGKLMLTGSGSVAPAANNLLSVDTSGHIKLAADDLISVVDAPNAIKRSSDGKLKATVQPVYNTTQGMLYLYDGDGSLLGSTSIPVGGSSLKSIQVVENPAGQPAGKYIEMVFETASGTDSYVYLNVQDLATVYTGGSGIDVSNANVLSVRIVSNGGLKFNAAGQLYVDLSGVNVPVSVDSGNSLTLGSDGKPYLASDYGTL